MPPNYTNSALNGDFTGTLQAFGGPSPARGWPGFCLVLTTAAFRPGEAALRRLRDLALLRRQLSAVSEPNPGCHRTRDTC